MLMKYSPLSSGVKTVEKVAEKSSRFTPGANTVAPPVFLLIGKLICSVAAGEPSFAVLFQYVAVMPFWPLLESMSKVETVLLFFTWSQPLR